MLKRILTATAFATLLSGCANGLSPVGVGLITDVKGPITATTAQGGKQGTSCATTIIGLINKGDASIEAAKANELGVKVMDEAEFLALLAGYGR